MPDFNARAGDTDVTIYLRLRDSTTGLAKTGLTFESAGAVASYVLPAAARAAITLATQTVTGAHSDGGFVEVDATNCKGLYRLDLPDAAVASGAYSLISIEFDGIIEETILLPLANSVNVVQVSGDATAADNAEAFFDGTGYAGTNNVIPTVTTLTGHTAQTGDAFARLGAPAGVSVSADIAAAKVDTAAILIDTAELQGDWVNGGRLDLILDATATASALATVDTNVDSILDDTGTAGVVVAAASKTGYALSAAGVQAVWDALTSALTTAGSIGKLIVDNLNATISSRSSHTAANVRTEMDSNSTQLAAIVADTNELQTDWVNGGRLDLILDATATATALATVDTNVDAILVDTADMQPKLGTPAADLAADIAAVKVDTAATLVDTNELQTDWANGGRLDLLLDATLADTAALADTAIPDSIPADGSLPTVRQALYMITNFLMERAVSGTTITVKKADGSTSLLTLTLDDATTPTSITRST